ncbi:MAG: hypothetical protein LBU83_05175 [Bacteroidales bacterium]|jgi:hypothetical protein|nr:hypothetical protein [Bacteroidales bacterium]
MKHLLYTLIGTLLLSVSCTQNLSSGDLVFVASENSDFEKSIVAVTKSDLCALNFTHVALINVTDSGNFVIEAVPQKGVIYSSFQEFKEENKNGTLYFASLKPEYRQYTESALGRAYSHLGKGYDYGFDFENDLYYCSELVYDAYAHATGNPNFFETPNMTFKESDTDEILPYWLEYFNKHQLPVPEGKPGISPNGLSRSEKLQIKKPKA